MPCKIPMQRGPELRVALVLVVLYLTLGLLQATSILKIDVSATIMDSLIGLLLFAALLFPAAFTGARLAPEAIPTLRALPERASERVAVLRKLSWGILFGAGGFLVNVGLSALFVGLWTAPTTQDYVMEFSLVEKIGASASSGIWEETVFRLFLISAILMVVRHRYLAALAANTAFTLMHLIFQHPPYNIPALTIVFLIGLIYTKAYLDHGLESAIAAHASMNFLSMTLGLLI
jgi:hypothetical protein